MAATRTNRRGRNDPVTDDDVLDVLTDKWMVIDEVVAAVGRSLRAVRRVLMRLDDELLIDTRHYQMGARWRTQYRVVARDFTRPLFNNSRHDARPLAEAFGGYTFTGV